MKPKFDILETVRILKYPGNSINARGIVRTYNSTLGLYWVTNMSMPYMGTVSDNFTEDELGKI